MYVDEESCRNKYRLFPATPFIDSVRDSPRDFPRELALVFTENPLREHRLGFRGQGSKAVSTYAV